jgi:phosphoglycolate phosphatase-like HAD superfamily hydrolase
MRPWVIFLDDGGVMNENRVRGEQWRRLVGEYFAPRLGGTHEAWAAANRAFTDELFDPANWAARLGASPDYQHFDYHYQLDWLSGMCTFVGVPMPATQDGYHMARQATAYITCRVRASFRGVVETIRQLQRDGYTLYTASGEPSWDLESYLGGMEVRECFTRLYGPDLIDTFKTGPAYYERIFADSGVDPADALVIDDNAQAVAWVRGAGASATQVVANIATAADGAIPSLAHLPAWLATVD